MTDYFCPRCRGNEVIEYLEDFDCILCKDQLGLPLEFSKEMFNYWVGNRLDMATLLSNNELSEISKILRGNELDPCSTIS